ncbi:MAG: cupin [Leptolinea sp.]|jgi:quercetin dioxygenase-like cupin family protein|nr:cupin [Leptolinea sp.]
MLEELLNGHIVTTKNEWDVSDIIWNKHATNEGVFIKHLIKGEATEGKFSCHLVKVLRGCEISDHTHPNNWELHEIICGSGIGYMDGKEIQYTCGAIITIPRGKNHRIVAGDQDLYLLAKFVPALV